MVQALEHAHAAIKEIIAGIDALAAQARQDEDGGRGQGRSTADVPSRGRGQGLRAARRRDADQGQARELRHGRRGARRSAWPSIPDDGARAARRGEVDLQGAEGEGHARRGRSSAASGSTAAKFDEIRPITIEVGVLPRTHGSARVHARRDPGARHRDARHRRRPAEDRDGRRRDVEALHAPLQLPAVLGR